MKRYLKDQINYTLRIMLLRNTLFVFKISIHCSKFIMMLHYMSNTVDNNLYVSHNTL